MIKIEGKMNGKAGTITMSLDKDAVPNKVNVTLEAMGRTQDNWFAIKAKNPNFSISRKKAQEVLETMTFEQVIAACARKHSFEV